MLKVIKDIFFQDPAAATSESPPYDDVQFSAAMLFLEAMHADHEVTDAERQAVDNSLSSLFNVSAQQAADIRNLAERHFSGVTSLHDFVTVVNRSFTPEQKFHIIEAMWRIAYADDELDKYEEHVIRRVADLLHISHAHFIRAKHQSRANTSLD